jgi:Flp pilus assembly secretin CpaC
MKTFPRRWFRHQVPPLALLLTMLAVADAAAQNDTAGQEALVIARGTSELLQLPRPITRVAVADSSIANVVVLSPRELLLNGITIGTTTLITWDAEEGARVRPIEVTIDAAALQRRFQMLYPNEAIEVTAMGNLVILSGTVSGGAVARQLVEIARATGGTVIENFSCARPSVMC